MLSLSILVCLICSAVARADTPTPTPTPGGEVPAGAYPVPLISRGTWGYGASYQRFDETTTANNLNQDAIIATQQFDGVQGYYNFIEFSTIGFGVIPNYDRSQFDTFVIAYFWISDNVTISIDSVQYGGNTYYDGEQGFMMGDYFVQWGSQLGATGLAFTYQGDLLDISESNIPLVNQYLTLNVTNSVSSPDTCTFYGFACFGKSPDPEPAPDWITITPFPTDHETDPMIDDETPSYNSFFTSVNVALNNLIKWIGNLIGSPTDLSIPSINDFYNDTGIDEIFTVINTSINAAETISNTPANASFSFDGWDLPLQGETYTIINPMTIDIKGKTDSIPIKLGSSTYNLTTLIRFIVTFPFTIGSLYGIVKVLKRIIRLFYGGVE